MNKPLLTLAASALVLAGTMGLAQAQTSGSDATVQQGQQGQRMMQQRERMMQNRQERRKYRRNDRRSAMRHHGMGYGMGQGMGGGMMGHGMGHGAVMQVMFAMVDANGDGSLSLAEVQDAHARIFAHMDADNDGQVTKDEIKAFFRGGKDRRGSSRRDRSDDTDDGLNLSDQVGDDESDDADDE